MIRVVRFGVSGIYTFIHHHQLTTLINQFLMMRSLIPIILSKNKFSGYSLWVENNLIKNSKGIVKLMEQRYDFRRMGKVN